MIYILINTASYSIYNLLIHLQISVVPHWFHNINYSIMYANDIEICSSTKVGLHSTNSIAMPYFQLKSITREFDK